MSLQLTQSGGKCEHPPRRQGRICDPSTLQGVITSIKARERYQSNGCIAESTWSDFLTGEEDVDDIHEFVVVEEGADARGCTHKVLPSLLYIGLNHGGSTTFASLLNDLPGWSYGARKEHLHFGGMAWSYLHNQTCLSTIRHAAYANEFRVGCHVNKTFDASPFYWALGNDKLNDINFLAPPGKPSLRLLKKVLGSDIKMVFALKDPVDWLSSNKVIGNPQAEALACYADSLDGWLSEFPRESFLFLKAPDVFEDLPGTIKRIAEFAGMPTPTDVPTSFQSGRRRTKSVVPAKYRPRFHDEHRHCTTRLEAQTGLSFDWK